MITYESGYMLFTCDECGAEKEYPSVGFREGIQMMRDEGWKTTCDKNRSGEDETKEWFHYCETCKEEIK